MSGLEKQDDDQSQTIVERVLAIEREADEIVARAKAQESSIAANVEKYVETLRKETDTKIQEELKRLSSEIETRVAEEKEALERARQETITQITGISQDSLESCARDVVSRILEGKK
jgi:F0F1-type ATP synthase membrane subunit b/b'